MFRRIAVTAVIVCGMFMPRAGAMAEDAARPDDLLTLAKGAVLVSAAADPVKALALTDGDAESNWNASTKKVPLPHVFTFELIAPATIAEVGIIGAGERPGGVWRPALPVRLPPCRCR